MSIIFSINPYKMKVADLPVTMSQHAVLIAKASHFLDERDDRSRTPLEHFVEECQELLTELALDNINRDNVISEAGDVVFTALRVINKTFESEGIEPVKLVDLLSVNYDKLSQDKKRR